MVDENVRRQNQKALDYFEMLKQKRHVNFVGWNVFHKLYRTETFTYYMENFLIMNFPGLSRVLFKIRYQLLKILGKR